LAREREISAERAAAKRRDAASDIELENESKRPKKDAKCSDLMVDAAPLATLSAKSVTRISASQKRMYNPLATPLNDPGCIGLPQSWNESFRDASLPVHIDIGCARGKLVFDLAALNPSKNFIGIEIRDKLVEDANSTVSANKSVGKGNENCAFVCANILSEKHRQQLEESFVSLPNIERISILFPDPWIKNKHRDRRVVQVPVLQFIARLLRSGGELIIASDVEDMVVEAKSKLQECSSLFAPATGKLRAPLVSSDASLTPTDSSASTTATSVKCAPMTTVLNPTDPGDPVSDHEDKKGSGNTDHTIEYDALGYVLSNPFYPLTSEREQVSID
jgi:tRNA (guanine-N7-)-methyltransferase